MTQIMVNMTPAVPSLTAEPPIIPLNGNGSTNGHSGIGLIETMIVKETNLKVWKILLSEAISVNCPNVDIIILQ